MNERFISYALIGFAVSLAYSFLTKATGKKITANQQGGYLLRMNKLYYFLGIVSVVLAGVFVVVPPLVDTVDITMLIIIILMLLLFGGLGTLCLLYYKNHYVLFDNERIEVRNQLGKKSSMKWANIEQASFSAFSGLLTLTSTAGEKIKVHQHLVGLAQFTNELEKQKGWRAKDLKLPVNKE